jgi:adenylosuccinate lyase
MNILEGMSSSSGSFFTVSPLDGRYSDYTKEIAEVFSNPAYYMERIKVELAYLKAQLIKNKIEDFKIPEIDFDDYAQVCEIYRECIEIEKTTNHDIKAIEYYIRTIVPEKYHCYIHCGLTSQDVNSIAQTIMLKNACSCVSDEYDKFVSSVEDLIKRLSGIPVMTYTHGQPAVSTYFDIEVQKRLIKIQKSFDELLKCCNNLTCKFSGSVGNFTTHSLMFKEEEIDSLYDFLNQELIAGKDSSKKIDYNLKFNKFAFQVDDYNSYSQLFTQFGIFFANMKDFSYNLWLRLFSKELIETSVKGEIGSSVMPHKINPVGIEMAMNGVADLAISQCFTTASSLLVTAHSRDISDIFKMRFSGEIFGMGLLMMKYISKDVKRIMPNIEQINKILNENIGSLSEIIQTRLRIENIGIDAYKVLEGLTKGKSITYEQLHAFIDELKEKHDLSDELVTELKGYRIDKPFGFFSHYKC